jgi:hypothetical protein
MNPQTETLEAQTFEEPVACGPPREQIRPERVPPVLPAWVRAQSVNVTRHAAALRPFQKEEFSNGVATPSDGHIGAVNHLITSLRAGLFRLARNVSSAAAEATRVQTAPQLQKLVRRKERAHISVQAIERIWDFYFELFGQRQGRYANWLLSCDRIALDSYQVAWLGLGEARPIPAPPPFCYMRTGFSPSTFGRGIPLRHLGHQLNPFPLIQLPYHRLVNPWTLGAVLHEVSHNLQSDLKLSKRVPRNIALRLLRARHGRSVALVWARWNREMFADLSALLLGGPAVVGSLLDVVGRAPETTLSYNPHGPHPTPYLRAFISIELLRRMGFPERAEQYRRLWTAIYPNGSAGNIPRDILRTFAEANALVVDTVCFQPYAELGNKSLWEVMRFGQKEQTMVEEAARRLAAGNDPGIVPERFLIGAARFALDNRLARPGVITENFYKELARR